MQLLDCQLEDRGVDDSRVERDIHENVDAAKYLRCFSHGPGDLLAIAKITDDAERGATTGLYLTDDRVHICRRQGQYHDLGALPCKEFCRRTANPSACARHDGYFSSQFSHFDFLS
ncbi:hypothetical protein D3C80_1772140 [compost metagenome]